MGVNEVQKDFGPKFATFTSSGVQIDATQWLYRCVFVRVGVGRQASLAMWMTSHLSVRVCARLSCRLY